MATLKKANFTVDKRNYDGEFPYFRKPVEIGAFSLDMNRTFHHNKSQMKYFIRPKDFYRLHFDLKQGYNTMIKKDESTLTYIDDVLRWIMKNEHKFTVGKPLGDEEHKR